MVYIHRICALLLLSTIALVMVSGQHKPRLGEGWKISGPARLPAQTGRTVEIVDHSFFKRADGKWVVWAAIRGAVPDHPFYAWEANLLTDTDWIDKGIVAKADSSVGENARQGLYAPHIRKIKDFYYCFYTTANSMRIMKSVDGFQFTRIKDRDGNYAFIKQLVGRDIMIFDDSARYFAFSTVSTFSREGWNQGFIINTFAKFQDDPLYWPYPEYTIVNAGGIGGNGHVSSESPFVVKYQGYYYLFRASSMTYKTYVYRSNNLFDFGVNNDSKLIAVLPLKAAEVIEDNGQWYISDLDDFKGLKIYPLYWETVSF